MSKDSQLPNPGLQNKNLQEPTVLDLYKSVTKDWTSFYNFIRSLWDARRRDEFNRSLAADAAYAIEELKPEEPARALVFLASPLASYTTGAALDVSGGFNKHL